MAQFDDETWNFLFWQWKGLNLNANWMDSMALASMAAMVLLLFLRWKALRWNVTIGNRYVTMHWSPSSNEFRHRLYTKRSALATILPTYNINKGFFVWIKRWPIVVCRIQSITLNSCTAVAFLLLYYLLEFVSSWTINTLVLFCGLFLQNVIVPLKVLVNSVWIIRWIFLG